MSPVDVDVTRQEVQIFDTFRKMFVSRIASPFDQMLWSYDVLLAAHTYPSVWYSCLAVAAAYGEKALSYSCRAGGDAIWSPNMFILKQYTNALNHLTSFANQPLHTVGEQSSFLLSCILLSGVCRLTNNAYEAVLHAQNGLRLFKQWKFQIRAAEEAQHARPVLDHKLISAIYGSYESQMLYNWTDSTTAAWPSTIHSLVCSEAPFTTTTEAFTELLPLFNECYKQRMYRFCPERAPFDAIVKEQEFQEEFIIWKNKFTALQKLPGYQRASTGSLLLRMYSIATELLSVSNSLGDKMDHEAYRNLYETFVRLNELALMQEDETALDMGPSTRVFSYSSGICSVAAAFAHACRITEIRKTIIRQLRQYRRQDGVWQSACVAAIQQAVLDHDEEIMFDKTFDRTGDCKCVYEEYVCNLHRVAFCPHVRNEGQAIVIRLLTKEDIQQGRLGREMLVTY